MDTKWRLFATFIFCRHFYGKFSLNQFMISWQYIKKEEMRKEEKGQKNYERRKIINMWTRFLPHFLRHWNIKIGEFSTNNKIGMYLLKNKIKFIKSLSHLPFILPFFSFLSDQDLTVLKISQLRLLAKLSAPLSGSSRHFNKYIFVKTNKKFLLFMTKCTWRKGMYIFLPAKLSSTYT